MVVILAGGRGERLGGAVKADLAVGGVRLIERHRAALEPLGFTLLASIGHFALDDLELPAALVPIADLADGPAGPLAGVAAAMAWCLRAPEQPNFLLSVAVDTPFFPPEFVRAAKELIGAGTGAVVARHRGQDYPTNALWNFARLADLPQRTRSGTAPKSLKALAAELGAVGLEWPEMKGGDPFANANTPADLAALDARAAAWERPGGAG